MAAVGNVIMTQEAGPFEKSLRLRVASGRRGFTPSAGSPDLFVSSRLCPDGRFFYAGGI